MLSLAFDLGGTRARCAVADGRGKLLSQAALDTPAAEGPERIVAALAEMAGDVDPEGACALAAVAAPGPLDPATGLVFETPNLPGWEDFPLAEALSGALGGRPVRVHNDATLAALAEARLGAGQGLDPIVYLTVSTGVGGGIVIGGAPYGGARGLAGELGHAIVRAGGPLCGAGHAGCLEALASGTAVARAYRARAERELGSDAAAGAREVAERARDGDYDAEVVLLQAAEDLGLAVGSFANAFDPAAIVIGGGLGLGAWDLLEAPLRAAAEGVMMAPAGRRPKILRADLGDDAGLVGAALWAAEGGGED